jgi:MFS family permease
MTSANRWTLVATILASSMTFIDATVVNVALPALQADLHATITDVQWVIEAYALFLGALILVGGSMGDQFGRKKVFLFGVAFFAAASVMCGVAGSPRVLIVGRALQGSARRFSRREASQSSARPSTTMSAVPRSARGLDSAQSRLPPAR